MNIKKTAAERMTELLHENTRLQTKIAELERMERVYENRARAEQVLKLAEKTEHSPDRLRVFSTGAFLAKRAELEKETPNQLMKEAQVLEYIMGERPRFSLSDQKDTPPDPIESLHRAMDSYRGA